MQKLSGTTQQRVLLALALVLMVCPLGSIPPFHPSAAPPPLLSSVTPSGSERSKFAPDATGMIKSSLAKGWTELLSGGGPSARSNASITYDPAEGAVLLFGGWNGSFLGDTWEYRGGTWLALSTSTHPAARSGAILVFDPVIGAAVLFGGTQGTLLNDTWLFRAGSWTQQAYASSPSPRAGAAAAFDPERAAIVLFGGMGTHALSDTWSYTAGGWSLLAAPTHPRGAAYASMVYDPAEAGLLLYGGASPGATGESWKFALGVWTLLNDSRSPPARFMAGFAFDSADGFALLFGGRRAADYGNSYEFVSGNWSSPIRGKDPSNRSSPAMVFDEADGYVLLFGGSGSSFFGDTWAFKIRVQTPSWSQIPVLSDPVAREEAVIAYDPADGYTVLFGGWNASATHQSVRFFNDTWTFKAGVWVRLHPPLSPPPRRGAMMVFDASDGYLLLFGGSDGTRYLNDTWSFRGGFWTQLSSAGAPPTRRSAAIAFDETDGYVLMFGGHNGSGILPTPGTRYFHQSDTWIFRAGTWSQLTPTVHPSARSESNMEYDAADGYVLLFGGYVPHANGQGDVEQSDTWKFVGGTWTNLTSSLAKSPPSRDGQPMVFDPNRGYVLMFGGDRGKKGPADVWGYRDGWTQLCKSCATVFHSESHAAFDSSDAYVVFLGGNAQGGSGTVAWVSPIYARPVAKPAVAEAGIPVAFKVAVTGGVGPFRYAWNFGDGNVSSLAAPSERFPNSATFPINVTVTDRSGVAGQGIIQLQVLGQATASATVTPTVTDVGRPVAFAATVAGGTAPYVYQWDFGDGGGSNQSDPSHVYSVSGSIGGGLTVTDFLGAIASTTFIEVVHSAPTSSIGLAGNATDVGLPLSFHGVASNGTGPFSFNWSFGDGSTSTGESVSHAFNRTGSFVVTLGMADSFGVGSNSSVSVFVNPAFNGTAVLPSSGDVGQNLSFSVATVGGTGPTQADWEFGDNGSAAGPNATHAFASSGVFNVSVLLRDSVGESFAVWGLVAVALDPSASPSTSSNGTAAIGQNISFYAGVSNGTGPFTFRWIFGDGNSSDLENSTHSYGTAGSYAVELIATDSTGTSVIAWITVVVNERRVARVVARRDHPSR